jgi:hypothetical protein
MSDFNIYYRISDRGNPLGHTDLSKTSLGFINRKLCFKNLVRTFGIENLHIVCDNCIESTIEFIRSFGVSNIEITHLGNIRSFKHILKRAIDETEDEDIIYFVEDDYAHNVDSEKLICEGLEIADYVTLNDCTSKYTDMDRGGYNPYCVGGGENTKVVITKSTHWKEMISTTMTFASRKKTLQKDYELILAYNKDTDPHPMDFLMFIDLTQTKGRKMLASIPGRSAHIGLEMSPFVDWEGILKREM